MSSLAYAALWLFVFSVPWESLIRINSVNVMSKATGAIALGFAVIAFVMSGRIRRWHVLHLAAFLFLIWAAATLSVMHSGDRLPYKYWTFVQLFLVLWIVWEVAVSGRRQIGLLTAYTLGAYITAFGTIMVFRRSGSDASRFAAGGADPNDLAMILALGLPMAWYLGMTYRRPLLRWVCRAYLPIALLAIALTGSRGGMLAGLTALLIVPLAMTLSPGRLATAIVMLVVSGALAMAYVPDKIVERLATTGVEVEDLSLGGRVKLWKAGIRAFGQHPVTGVGVSGFKTAVDPLLGTTTQVAHNSFVSVLVEEGVVGFVLYMMMFVAVFLAVLDLPRIERRFALVLMATLLVAMMPLTWEDRKPVWIVLAMLLGFSQAYVAEAATGRWGAPARRAAPVMPPRRVARPREPLTTPGRTVDRESPA
jgi:O-antigen ligase